MKECWACGGASNLTQHHLRPLRYGGGNYLDNIVCLCRECHKIVETPKAFTRPMVERIDSFPRLETLLIARLLEDMDALKSSTAKFLAKVEPAPR